MNALQIREEIKIDKYNFVYSCPSVGSTFSKMVLEGRAVMPFKLIELSEGTSTCRDCGQVYSGKHLGKCERTVMKYNHRWSKQDSSNWNDWKNKIDKDRYYTGENKIEECMGEVNWSLGYEYDKQQNTLNNLESIAYKLYCRPVDPKHCFVEISKNELEIFMLRDQVFNLQMDVQRLMSAMSQVAEKMNQAGNSLRF